jgi:hypothetical protein
MPNANWWADANDASKLPKRGFRFLVQIEIGGKPLTFMAKSVDRPEFTVTSTAHKFFNHTFYYPGRVEWNQITLTLVDAMEPNGSEALYEYLGEIGYITPFAEDGTTITDTSITKKKATKATGIIVIQEIDGEGKSGGDWTLKNPFITTANFGSHSYESEDLLEISITLQYDWAVYKKR